MPKSIITWAGRSSAEYGITVERFPALNRPSRKYEKVSVPGRNGDIYFYQDSFSNYIQQYEIYAGSRNGSAPDAWTEVFNWLYPEDRAVSTDDFLNLTINGYHQLIDSYEPNAIRLAAFNEAVEVANEWNQIARAAISFDCRPERFTSDAFTPVSFTASGGHVTNNTKRNAKPCLKVYGSGAGTLTVGNEIISISAINGYIYIDSELKNCYKGMNDLNLNNLVTLTSEFPILKPGNTYITWTGGITQIDVIPRWWNL